MAKSKKSAKAKTKKSPAKKTTPKKSQPKVKAKAATKPAAKPAARAAVAPKTSSKIDFKKLVPLDDRLLVKPEGAAEKTAGGIYIPVTVTADRPNRGTVLASGRGKRNKKGQIRPLDVEVGDTVLFAQYAGAALEVDGQEYLILREEEILGIVT